MKKSRKQFAENSCHNHWQMDWMCCVSHPDFCSSHGKACALINVHLFQQSHKQLSVQKHTKNSDVFKYKNVNPEMNEFFDYTHNKPFRLTVNTFSCHQRPPSGLRRSGRWWQKQGVLPLWISAGNLRQPSGQDWRGREPRRAEHTPKRGRQAAKGHMIEGDLRRNCEQRAMGI